jgi:hypothetical protein
MVQEIAAARLRRRPARRQSGSDGEWMACLQTSFDARERLL